MTSKQQGIKFGEGRLRIEDIVRYIKMIPFNHSIRVTAALTEWENRLRVDYVIYDAQTGARMTKAYTRQVAVEISNEEMCFASPKVFINKLEPYFVD